MKAPIPDFVRALPPVVRTMLRQQCGGDWRRVERTADGGFLVHNQPREDAPAAPPPDPAPLRQPRPERPKPIITPLMVPARSSVGALARPLHPPGFRTMSKDGILVKPRTKPVGRRRRGAPRTATEHLKRLLDRGFQFVREPGGSRADVYYLGYELGQIWVADNTPRALVQQEYRLVVAKAAQIDRHFARR